MNLLPPINLLMISTQRRKQKINTCRYIQTYYAKQYNNNCEYYYVISLIVLETLDILVPMGRPCGRCPIVQCSPWDRNVMIVFDFHEVFDKTLNNCCKHHNK